MKKLISKEKLTLILALCLLTVNACKPDIVSTAGTGNNPGDNSNGEIISTLLPTEQYSPLNIPTPTFSVPFPTFSFLQSGEYILVISRGMYLISGDGEAQHKFSDLYGIPLYPDMNKYIAGSRIYDTSTQTILDTTLISSFAGCMVISSSIGQNYYTLKCDDGDLYVALVDEEVKTKINHRTAETDRFEAPIWSPDGKWISYLKTIPDPNNNSSAGISQLFLVDTTCLTVQGSCPTSLHGPIDADFFVGTAPYSWSPNSRYIAIPSMSAMSILVFDTVTNTIQTIEWDTGVYSVAWSPSGDRLAFCGYASVDQVSLAIYTIPTSGGPATFISNDIEDTTLLYWVNFR